MTELEKLKAIQDQSQSVGEFLDWIESKKGIVLAEYITEKVPNLALWPEDQKFHERTTLQRKFINVEKTLAEFFSIDLQKVEMEKRDLLQEIRKQRHDTV